MFPDLVRRTGPSTSLRFGRLLSSTSFTTSRWPSVTWRSKPFFERSIRRIKLDAELARLRSEHACQAIRRVEGDSFAKWRVIEGVPRPGPSGDRGRVLTPLLHEPRRKLERPAAVNDCGDGPSLAGNHGLSVPGDRDLVRRRMTERRRRPGDDRLQSYSILISESISSCDARLSGRTEHRHDRPGLGRYRSAGDYKSTPFNGRNLCVE